MCVPRCQSLYKEASGKVTVFAALWASQMWVPFSLITLLLIPFISPLLLLHLSDIVWEYDVILWYIWYCYPLLVIHKSRKLGVCFMVLVLG